MDDIFSNLISTIIKDKNPCCAASTVANEEPVQPTDKVGEFGSNSSGPSNTGISVDKTENGDLSLNLGAGLKVIITRKMAEMIANAIGNDEENQSSEDSNLNQDKKEEVEQ
jgi:hypothetical protein